MKAILFCIIILNGISLAGAEEKEIEYDRTYESVGNKDFKHSDKVVEIKYTPITYGEAIPLVIENKSKEVIKILWDESAFIDGQNKSERIIHEGVKFIEKGASIPPSIIPPNSKIEDIITPAARIISLSSGWSTLNICGDVIDWPEKGTTKDEDCLGKTFAIFLTYEHKGKKHSITMKYKYVKRIEKK